MCLKNEEFDITKEDLMKTDWEDQPLEEAEDDDCNDCNGECNRSCRGCEIGW